MDRPCNCEDILEAYVLGLAPGEEIDVEALCQAHPEHADELARMVQRWQGLRGLLAQAGGHPTANPALIQELESRLAPPGERYEGGAEIARGGMGVVLQVHDRDLGRRLAMKRMARNQDEQSVWRFVREAEITARLDHPGIVPVHELGVDDDGGGLLHDEVRGGPRAGRDLRARSYRWRRLDTAARSRRDPACLRGAGLRPREGRPAS